MKFFIKQGNNFQEVTEDEFKSIQRLQMELNKAAASPFAKGLLARKWDKGKGVSRTSPNYGRSREDAPQTDPRHFRKV